MSELRSTVTQKYWFVFYTKSRQEKRVRDVLSDRGFTVFLPLQKVMRQWSDRKKKVDVPLFNSYIFVEEMEDKIPAILQTPGIAWNIRHNDKPAVLRPRELDMIHLFLESGLFIESGTTEQFEKGDAVQILDGPLKGLTGTVERSTKETQFMVMLESIDHIFKVSIDPSLLKKL
jgi:transcription antitermination factor NusG